MKPLHKLFLTSLVLLGASLPAVCQESELLDFEKSVEKAVVDRNLPFLQKAYADDFRFKHGTGMVDTKATWLKAVEKNTYFARVVDSVEVEIHGKIGITNGKITITRKTDTGDTNYMIKYVRVYTKNDQQWQLIMHRTVAEHKYH